MARSFSLHCRANGSRCIENSTSSTSPKKKQSVLFAPNMRFLCFTIVLIMTAEAPREVILKMGRLTLVVPDGVSSLQADHIVIGWKDTREARGAVWDALPFLQRATRVTIVEACGPGEEKTALGRLDDVARYLSCHRIKGGPRSCWSNRDLWLEAVDPDRSGRTRRSVGDRCLRAQPPGRMDLRWHDARAAGGKSHLLPHVALISFSEWLWRVPGAPQSAAPRFGTSFL
jgi:hypothetical protein